MEKRGYLAGMEFIEPVDTIASQYFCNSYKEGKLETTDNINFTDGIMIQRIGKEILTGDEDWFYDEDTGTYYYYQFNKFNKDITGKYDKMLCNYSRWVQYKAKPKWSEFQGEIDNKIMFKFEKEDNAKPDISGFKKWLREKYEKNSPVEVYFILQYPEITIVDNDFNPTPRFKPRHFFVESKGKLEPSISQKFSINIEKNIK